MASRTRWIERPAPVTDPTLRLLCVPYAGGSASTFRAWCDGLFGMDVCAVQMPGRQRRIAEAPCRHMDEVIHALAQDLEAYRDAPLALFGDCTGAFLAFELCRLLRRTGRPAPVHLFVSCCRAPHVPRRHAPIHGLDDQAFRIAIRAFAVAPPWLLENSVALKQFLPLLRADFEVFETYEYAAEPPLDIPITAFAGTQDAVTSLDEVQAWADQTSSAFRAVVIDGGHDLAHTHVDELLGHLRQDCHAATADTAL